jgi:hypothetical protein
MVNMEIFEEQGSVRESSVDRDVPQKKGAAFALPYAVIYD